MLILQIVFLVLGAWSVLNAARHIYTASNGLWHVKTTVRETSSRANAILATIAKARRSETDLDQLRLLKRANEIACETIDNIKNGSVRRNTMLLTVGTLASSALELFGLFAMLSLSAELFEIALMDRTVLGILLGIWILVSYSIHPTLLRTLDRTESCVDDCVVGLFAAEAIVKNKLPRFIREIMLAAPSS